MGQRKTQRLVGCAVIADNHSIIQRIPDGSLALVMLTKNLLYFLTAFCIESNEPYQFKESTDSETFRKMSWAFSL